MTLYCVFSTVGAAWREHFVFSPLEWHLRGHSIVMISLLSMNWLKMSAINISLALSDNYSLCHLLDYDSKTKAVLQPHFVTLVFFSVSHRKTCRVSEDTLFSCTQCCLGLENGWSHFSIVVFACESDSGVCMSATQTFSAATPSARREV